MGTPIHPPVKNLLTPAPFIVSVIYLSLACGNAAGAPGDKIDWETRQLSDKFYTEGADAADFNRDGAMDIVAGPFWFEGPEFKTRHEYRPAKEFDPVKYSDNFLTFTGDFNADGWPDILCAPYPGRECFWHQNPGKAGGEWPKHLAYPMVGNESPVWGDVTGDGVNELIFCNQGWMGYAGADTAKPGEPWKFHAVSGKDKRYHKFTHGAGFGDIDGDGRTDILEAIGWWQQPEKIVEGEPWKFHAHKFGDRPAQILATDIDGDDLIDVIASWHCHHYGLLWWKQVRADDGGISWERHEIFTPEPDLADPGFRVSQLHAQVLVDMNSDGVTDILTGKRRWAHGPKGDKEPDAAPVIFWLELKRDGKGGANFTPRIIHDDSGVGTQVASADLNGDNLPDALVANKKGIFVHLQKRP